MRRRANVAFMLRATILAALSLALLMGPAGIGAVLASAGICACATEAHDEERPCSTPCDGEVEQSASDQAEAYGADDHCPSDCNDCGCCIASMAILPEVSKIAGLELLVPRELPTKPIALLPPTPSRVFRPPRAL